MKKFALFFTILITGITGFTQAVVTSIQYKPKGGNWNITFPVISLADKTNAQKINDYLQARELRNTTKKIKPANLFDRVKYINEDSINQTGITDLQYNVILNTPKMLSIELPREWMAAYPDGSSEYYNFNSQNGDLVLVEELFTPAGLKTVKQILIAQRRRLIEEAIEVIKKDADRKDELELAVETFASCNTEADAQYFSIQEDGIFFHKPDCFPHAFKLMEANLDVKIPYTLLTPYLSSFGKKALMQKDAVIKNDTFHTLKKPLYGTIDNKYKIVMQLEYFSDLGVSGVYYYTSQGICIEISGSITGKNIELKENNEKGDIMAVFKGEINNSTITGTWQDYKTGKLLPFAVKN